MENVWLVRLTKHTYTLHVAETLVKTEIPMKKAR